jgi:hypothetical protein
MVKLESGFSLNKFILAASPSKINERDRVSLVEL